MAEAREGCVDPNVEGTDEPNSYNAEAGLPLNISSFSTARPWYHLNTETSTKQPQTHKDLKQKDSTKQIQTFATSSISLLGGTSTFSGVLEAEAAALAAYAT